jgi:uncharacterized protein involved in exopolysaccharide biosynthesis
MGIAQDTLPGAGSVAHGPVLAAYHELGRLVRRRKWRILALLTLALSAGASFAYLWGPWYDSSAQLLVIKKRLDTTPISGPETNRGQEDYLSTHLLLIGSRKVIKHSIDKGELRDLRQFNDTGLRRRSIDWASHSILNRAPDAAPDERITTEIGDALVVTRDAQKPGVSPSNEILNLAFRGRVADDCPRVLNAVIASYQEFLEETYRNTNAETLELITQARDLVQKDLETRETAYQKFLADTPPLWKGPDKGTAQQDRLFKLDARLAALRVRKAETEASITMLEQALRDGRNPAPIVERLSGTPANGATAGPDAGRRRTSPEDELRALRIEEAKLLAVRAPNHPDVLAVRAQIENVQRLLQTAGAEASEQAARNRELGKLKLDLLRQELDDLTTEETALTRLFESERQGVSSTYLYEVQDETHRKGIERSRALYESVLHRLKEISSVKDFGGYQTQVISPPLRGQLAVKKYVLIFGLSLFCGLFVGLASAYLAEMSGRRPEPSSPTAPAEATPASCQVS